MRVLVTGGAGFLGRRIATCLAMRGDAVTSFDLSHAPAAARHSTVREQNGDITRPAEIEKIFADAKIDAVIHCAAVVGVVASIDDPRRTLDVNINGTFNLLEAMRDFGVRRLIHISSNEVYGDTQVPLIDEDHPLRPQLLYGISKLATEQLGRAYQDLHGIDCVNLRGSWIYAADFPRQRLPNDLISRLRRGEAVHIPQGRESVMDYVHADDFVDAVVAALDLERHAFDTYNIGSGIGTSLGSLVELLKELLPSSEVSVGPGRYEFRPGLTMRVQAALDIKRAARELGYAPRFDLKHGLKGIVEDR